MSISLPTKIILSKHWIWIFFLFKTIHYIIQFPIFINVTRIQNFLICVHYFLHEHLQLYLCYFQTDVRPLIQTEDEENYATVVGYSAFLHCEYFASPEAIVSW